MVFTKVGAWVLVLLFNWKKLRPFGLSKTLLFDVGVDLLEYRFEKILLFVLFDHS